MIARLEMMQVMKFLPPSKGFFTGSIRNPENVLRMSALPIVRDGDMYFNKYSSPSSSVTKIPTDCSQVYGCAQIQGDRAHIWSIDEAAADNHRALASTSQTSAS